MYKKGFVEQCLIQNWDFQITTSFFDFWSSLRKTYGDIWKGWVSLQNSPRNKTSFN